MKDRKAMKDRTRKITYKQFLKKLAATEETRDKTWVLQWDYSIVTSQDEVICPASRLKLYQDGIDFKLRDIWHAADNIEGHKKRIRQDLLKACGFLA